MDQAAQGQATKSQGPPDETVGVVTQAAPVLPPQPPSPAQPQVPQTPIQPVGGVHKEQLIPPTKAPEMVKMEEVGKDLELEPEVEGWIDHLKEEGEIKLPEPIKDDKGNVLMAEMPVQVVQDKIVVPITQQSFAAGLKKPVTDSARWLSEWVKRLKRVFGNKVVLKQE